MAAGENTGSNLRGTQLSLFRVQDVQVKRESATVIGFRDNTDAAYVIARAGDAVGDDDLTNRRTVHQMILAHQALGGF